YVPIDPSYPPERLSYMLEDSDPVALLTQVKLESLFSDLREGLPVIDLGAETPPWSSYPESNPDRRQVGLMPHHLAYVIYTSGSTGLPKGVAIEHGNAVNFISWGRAAFADEVFERTLFSTSLNFDLAVFECFTPLTVGGTVMIVRDALDLARQPVDVTLINTVPSAMTALVEMGLVPKTVRQVNLAGEPL